MNKIKKIVALVLSMTTLLSLASCTGGGSGENSDSQGSGGDQQQVERVAPAPGASISQSADIVAAVQVDFTTMDPVDTSDTLSGGIQRLVMDGLFGFDDDMNLIEMLATGYEANDDATEYIIPLREGISFSDGTPWNASAAKANFDKLGDKELALKRTSLLSGLLKETTVVDEYTVKIVLNEPFGAFVNTLAHPATIMMSPVQIEKGPEVCAAEPVGTGQYKFVSWTVDQGLKVELNKEWWGFDAAISGGTPLAPSDAGFKSVTFKPVTEGATRVVMMQSGDAQLTWVAPAESIEVLKNDPNIHVEQVDSIVNRYLFINTAKEGLKDVRVRQAINHAINKDALIQIADAGLATPGQSIIAKNVQFYKENPLYEYNPEKAKELLAEAGFPDGLDLTLLTSNGGAGPKRAEIIKQQLDLAGFNITIQVEESALVNAKTQDVSGTGEDAPVELFLSGWSPSTGDADWGLRPMLATESFPPLNYNIGFYSNPDVDRLLKEALQTADPEKRRAAYAEVQDIVWEESPIVVLSTDIIAWATSSNIFDIKIYPDGAVNLRNARMAEEE